MAGHSKWENIKRKKGKVDQERGKQFAILSKNISIAVKEGKNRDPAFNPRLRSAITKAKELNMPVSRINNAIDKSVNSTGEGEQFLVEVFMKEGICAILEVNCDNKQQVISEINSAVNKFKFKSTIKNSVDHMFTAYNTITLFGLSKKVLEEDIINIALDINAEEYSIKDDDIIFYIKERFSFSKREMEENFKSFVCDFYIGRSIIPLEKLNCSQEACKINSMFIDRVEDIVGIINVISNSI